MENCIFCKIIKGEIPSYKVYEDRNFIAFLDINPQVKAHTLIIPKKHYENIFDCKDQILKKITPLAKKISNHYKEKLNCTGVNIFISSGKSAEQEIPHLHLHICPRFDNDNHKLMVRTNYKKENLEELQNILKIK